MLALWIILGILGGLFLIFFIVLFLINYSNFYSPIKGQNNDHNLTAATLRFTTTERVYSLIDGLLAVSYEDVWTTSFDKKKLHARLYKNDSKVVCIMMHGYRGTAIRDFSGGGKLMIDSGYNVILIDERGHGQSEGHQITFGIKEKRDAKSWIDFAYKTFGNDIKIVLIGISMGAASALLASDNLKEGDLVIADCPYVTTKSIICNVLKMRKLNPKLVFPIVNLGSLIFGHANLAKEDAYSHVKNSKAKFLIIHGDIDSLVPYTFSKALADSFPDKVRYELFKGAEHGISYIIDEDRYKKIVTDFINNN